MVKFHVDPAGVISVFDGRLRENVPDPLIVPTMGFVLRFPPLHIYRLVPGYAGFGVKIIV